MRLSESFLDQYRHKGDVFPNLLSRSVYLSKYCRGSETWSDTIRRVVEGNTVLDPSCSMQEAEALFDCFWRMHALPPGRGLWTGGVPNIPVGALYNCWYVTIRSVRDWEWMANRLLEGGGVGVGLGDIHELPAVAGGSPRLSVLCSQSHPNESEFITDSIVYPGVPHHVVPDSRQGWAEALRIVLEAAFAGQSLTINVSAIRPRGMPIRTFGGIAPGPGPLVTMLRNVWAVVRRRAGRKLTSVDGLDITTHTGACIRSGGVRRSALICLGDSDDDAFRRAKATAEDVMSHRSASNNSITFYEEEELKNFDWHGLVRDQAEYGEPGFLNLWRVWQTSPEVKGTNPCGEALLDDYEACCLSEVWPARMQRWEIARALRLTTRYTLRQRLMVIDDYDADIVRQRNMRIGVGLGGICDFSWVPSDLEYMYREVRSEANRYADDLGVNAPITCTVVKPSGTISTMVGSSHGVHSAHAPYYIRRTRIMKAEPIAEALIEAGVPHEECKYDESGHTWVFSFPMANPGASAYSRTESVVDQLQRVLTVQDSWTDQAVSSTISFGEDETETLANYLSERGHEFKSMSCLPRKHAYVQAPYSECTESEYREMAEGIFHGHPLVRGSELNVEECEGGVCPVV